MDRLNHFKSVVKRSCLPKEEKSRFLQILKDIKKRQKDENVYIGIMGDAKSGKSTLASAIINTDDSVFKALKKAKVPTFLRYAKKEDFWVKLKGGRVLTYSKDKYGLLQIFYPTLIAENNFFRNLNLQILSFFGTCKEGPSLYEMLDTALLSASSRGVESITICCPSEVLQEGLVLVDIPDFNTEQSDCLFFAIPEGDPLGADMANYMSEDESRMFENGHFFITKVELIHNKESRNSSIDKIRNDLKNRLHIADANIHAAPSLLFMEQKCKHEQRAIVTLAEEEGKALHQDFINETTKVLLKIVKSRQKILEERKLRLFSNFQKGLKTSFISLRSSLNAELTSLEEAKVEPLDDFIQNRFSKFYYSSNLGREAKSAFDDLSKSEKESFLGVVRGSIRAASSKDEAQSVMKTDRVSSKEDEVYGNLYRHFGQVSDQLMQSYIVAFDDFEKEFCKEYGLEGLGYEFTNPITPNWQIYDRFSLNRSGLTTSWFKRMWKDLSEIKQQMIDEVTTQLTSHLERICDNYRRKIDYLHQNIESQLEKGKKEYINKYASPIQKRIKEDEKRGQFLHDQLGSIETSISDLYKEIK